MRWSGRERFVGGRRGRLGNCSARGAWLSLARGRSTRTLGLQMQLGAGCQAIKVAAFLVPMLAWATDDPEHNPSMQLFLEACASTYAYEPRVAEAMKSLSFSELAGTDADKYLLGQPGRAWVGTIDTNRYGVAVQPNGLCTVFVHAGDATQLQSAVEAWLPPEDLGISVKKMDLTTQPALPTTSYELLGGQVRERWVVTISTDPASPLRAMLSWTRL
jgi:hypothetical protein